jgi:hypothetical protein
VISAIVRDPNVTRNDKDRECDPRAGHKALADDGPAIASGKDPSRGRVMAQVADQLPLLHSDELSLPEYEAKCIAYGMLSRLSEARGAEHC